MNASKTKRTAKGWKVIFPLLAFFLCLSCNKDDDDEQQTPVIPPVQSFLKVTIEGTEYTFNHFVVETQTVVEPDYTYVDLHVTASIEGDETKSIEFNLEQDVPGTETIYFFYLMSDGEFDTDHTGAAFNTNVTTNSNRRIIGTCSGSLANVDNTDTIAIANGSFDISY